MRKQLAISAALHLAALVALLITIPQLTQEVDMSQEIIPVDIVNVADVTNTKVSPTPSPKPAPTPTKTVAPKPVEQEQPKPEPPKPPDEKPPEKQPTPDDKAEVIPDKTKPKEEPKKPEPPKEQPKPEKPVEKPSPPKDPLASILKNVEKLKDKTPTSPTPNPDAEESDKPVTSTAAPALGSQLSISEIDALRRQIMGCWNVPAGARGLETMSVEIYLEVDENRIPTRVEVVDKARMASDSFFRTVAESAQRALLNPRCRPLMLPPDKHDQWSKIRMTFNPKDMLM